MWSIKGPKGGNFKQLKFLNVIYSNKTLFLELVNYKVSTWIWDKVWSLFFDHYAFPSLLHFLKNNGIEFA